MRTLRRSLPLVGLVGHLEVPRTGEHEVYLGHVTVYWSQPQEHDGRRQVIVSGRWLGFCAAVDAMVKTRWER